MTKIYSSAPKNGLRCCVGPEIMKKKIKYCAAVLRPLDAPSTLWKYGRVLSHSAVLCITRKCHILIEYSATNLVHINKIGGFKKKESEIGPYFEYRGFIFHYISPIQKPRKRITVRDFALKMAHYMCNKPYDVFTHNCHQARYLTMKYFGMKSHDPFNIKYNVLFQGVADYFTEYNTSTVRKNLELANCDNNSEPPHCNSDIDLINEEKQNKNNNKLNKSLSTENNQNIQTSICKGRSSSMQNIAINEDYSNSPLYDRNIHKKSDNHDSNLFTNGIESLYFSDSSSDEDHSQNYELKRCLSNSFSPYYQPENSKDKSSSSESKKDSSPLESKKNSSASLKSKTDSSSVNSDNSTNLEGIPSIPHSPSKKNHFFIKRDKSEIQDIKLKKKHSKRISVSHAASENIPQLANERIQNIKPNKK